MKSNNSNYGGVGFCGLLTVLFVALKLTGSIDWSWLWVVSPLWIKAIFLLVLAILAAIAD